VAKPEFPARIARLTLLSWAKGVQSMSPTLPIAYSRLARRLLIAGPELGPGIDDIPGR